MFVDAPHVLLPVDLSGLNTNSLGAAEVVAEKKPEETDPAEIPRGWWRSNPERTRYDGVADSLATLRDILAKDRFEVRLLSGRHRMAAKKSSPRVCLVLVKALLWVLC